MKKELSILIILLVSMINNSLLSSNNNLANKLSGNILKSQPLENHSLENGYSWSTSSGSINGSIANLTVDQSSTATYIVQPSIICPQPIVIYTLKWDPINVVTPDPVISNQTSNTSVTWGISGPTNIDPLYYVNDPDHMINFIGTQSLIPGIYNCTYGLYAENGWVPIQTCTFNVSVIKITPSCPSSGTYYFTDPNGCTADVNIPNATFNYPFNGTITYKITNNGITITGNGFPGTQTLNKGTNTIEYTFSLNGQTETCSFTIDIKDAESPKITCPAPFERNTYPGLCSKTFTYMTVNNLNFQDNCDQTPQSVFISFSGATFMPWTNSNTMNNITLPEGTTTVSVKAYDNSNNVSNTCSYTITIKDNELPVIKQPGNIVVNTDNSKCSADVTLPNPFALATDNCRIYKVLCLITGVTKLQAFEFDKNNPVIITFSKGVSNVMYQALDPSGNSSFVVFTVTVNDNEDPVITSCPENSEINTDPDICLGSFFAPDASDNCPNYVYTCSVTNKNNKTKTTTINKTSEPIKLNKGSNDITLKVVDESGRSFTCPVFTKTVVDKQGPTITCPNKKDLVTDQGVCFASLQLPLINEPIEDNCDLGDVYARKDKEFPFKVGPNPITVNLGVTLIEQQAYDLSRNYTPCLTILTVVDNQPPTFTCPGDINVFIDPGSVSCTKSVTIPNPIDPKDNCSKNISFEFSTEGDTKMASLVFDPYHPNTYDFEIGTTVATFTGTDESKKSNTCSFTINVKDKNLPTISCPQDFTLKTDPGVCTAPLKLLDKVTPKVHCGVPIITYTLSGANTTPFENIIDPNNPGTVNLGIDQVIFPMILKTKVKYIVYDKSGNSANCSVTVSVVDQQKPDITNCPGNQKFNVPFKYKTQLVKLDPKAVDNCGITSQITKLNGPNYPNVTLNLPVDLYFKVGTTNVEYFVKDVAGNDANQQCKFSIEVIANNAVSSAQPGNWTVASTWSGGVVPSSSEDVQITSGHTINVAEDAICNNLNLDGNLIVESGKTLTVNNELYITATDGSISKGVSSIGQLVLADNSAQLNVLGQVSIGRKIGDLKYHLSSIPFETNEFDLLTGYTVAYYSELTGTWVNLVKGQMLEQGKVYSIKNANNPLYPASTDLIFTVPNSTTLATGTITIPLTHTVGIGKGNGWNLVPNSYPCAANWKTMTTSASPTIYYWDGSKYVNYNKFNDENTGGTSIIPQGEGFFVYCPDKKNGCLLTMTNEDRLASNVSYSVSKKGSSTYPQIPNRLSLIVSGNGYTDQSVIAFVNDATSEYDVNYDAYKLFSTQADVPLLNSNSFSKQYSVNYLPSEMVNQSKVQLEFTVGTAGEYTINAENLGSFDATESIMLVDTKTGTRTDLTQTGYTFTSEAVKADQRFYVEFIGLPTSVKKQNLDSEWNIFTDKDQIVVQNKTGANAQGTVTVYNVLGKEITTRNLTSNTETRIDMNTQANAIYFVKVKTQNQTLIKKVGITK